MYNLYHGDMKKLLYFILGAALFIVAGDALAVGAFPVATGGTGSTTLTGILAGNGTSPVQSVIIGSGCTFSGDTLSCPGTGGSGTITQVNTTFPILGGPITTTGTLTFGGLSTSTDAVIGNIPYFSGVNTFANIATSTLTATSPLTGSFTHIGTTGSLGCQTASGSQAGCLSSTDWNTFNNKGSGSVTSVGLSDSNGTLTIGGSPITTSGTLTATLNLAHANAWSALQSFANATSTLFSATTEWLPSLATSAGTFLAADANGKIIATSSPTGSNFFTNSGIYTYLSTGTNLGVGSTTPYSQLALAQNPSVQVASTSVYSGAGTYTWTAPNNSFIVVQVWGAGGAGAGNAAGNGGSGGGAGAFVGSTTIATISSGTNITVIVGQGGRAGTATAAGVGGTGYAAGGTGTFVGSGGAQGGGGGGGGSSAFGTYVIAAGGGGGCTTVGGGGGGASGTSGGTGCTNASDGKGGGGGAATAGSGTTGGTGASTQTGTNGSGSENSGGGGGGSSAGVSGNGTSASNGSSVGATGSGGATHGTAGTGADSGGGGSAGEAGGNPGAGGGGNTGTGSGFNGADGKIIITTYSYSSPENPPFIVQLVELATEYVVDEIDAVGHLITGGTSPTCGTGCSSITGDDRTMNIITGSSITSITVNFANTWSVSPICVATEDDSGLSGAVDASTTKTTLVLTASASLTSKHIGVICQGSNNFTY